MVVGLEQVWGSVRGGNLEETAVRHARELAATGANTPDMREVRLNEHAHTEHGRQCCGGVVLLLLEPLSVRPTVAIFGVGHVGYEPARILSRLELQLHLVDSRADQLEPLRLADMTESVADVAVHQTLIGELVLERLPAGSHVLIMTHDHAEDFALCDAALRLTEADHARLGSIGLIGSSVKWTRFQRMLAAEGHSATSIRRITCPIGLPGIPGKDPATIAIAVSAALARVIADPAPERRLDTQHSAP